jgi:putative aminopeptidase FrvX
MNQLASLLQAYTTIPAPSGHEEVLGDRVAADWSAHGPVQRDPLGNRWLALGAGDRHIAIIAHLDEVGFVVRKVEPDGFLRIHRLGGLPERVLPMQQVLVLGRKGPVAGVIGAKSHHYTPQEERYRVLTADELYLDIGASSATEVRAAYGINVGAFGVFARTFRRQGDLVFANALDDRIGLAVLSVLAGRLAANPPPLRVTLVASVQEEFTLRGVLPAIRTLDPDLILSVDITPACDTPDLKQRSDLALGAGPALTRYSFHSRGTLGGVIPPGWLVERVEAIADEAEIRWQPATFFGGLTDASFAQLEGRGAPALDFGIPARYTHTPVEVCSLVDAMRTCDLLEACVRNLLNTDFADRRR